MGRLLALVSTVVIAMFFYVGCNSSSNTASEPGTAPYKLDYTNVTLTQYHTDKISKAFDELLGETIQYSVDQIHPMASAEDIFNLASAGFGDLTGSLGLISTIAGWCSPNYAQMDYQLEQKIQSEITQMQTQLNTISSQISSLQTTVSDDFNYLFSEISTLQQNNYKSSVDSAVQAVANLSSGIRNCQAGSSKDLATCLTNAMSGTDPANMILNLSGANVISHGDFDNSYSPDPSSYSSKEQYDTYLSQNYNTILENADNSEAGSVYTDLNNFYSAIKTQAMADPGNMSNLFNC